MAGCYLCDYPLLLAVAYLFLAVEQFGVSYFEADVNRVCCGSPAPGGNSSWPGNSTPAEDFCEERENLQFQQDTLGCANVFLLVCFLILGVTQILTFHPSERIACISNAAQLLRFVARRGLMNFFALLTTFAISIAMGMSTALIRHTCIKDTPIFDVYLRYIGLGFFNTALIIIVLAVMLARMNDFLNKPRGGNSSVRNYREIRLEPKPSGDNRTATNLLAEDGGDITVISHGDVASAGLTHKRVRGQARFTPSRTTVLKQKPRDELSDDEEVPLNLGPTS